MHYGLHHFSRRQLEKRGVKTVTKGIWVARMDKVIFPVAVLGPLAIVPQAWDVWSTRQATGVSPLAWAAFSVISLLWLMYGIVHREKPIIYANTLGAILNVVVLLGVFLYR